MMMKKFEHGKNAKRLTKWEKGLIENANKLVRQYIPKKANFNEFTEHMEKINQVQYKINSEYRGSLNFYALKEASYLNLYK
jgi:IS30 family transposase